MKHYRESVNTNICTFDTDSCLILTRQKVGTSYIRSYFDLDSTPAFEINLLDNKFTLTTNPKGLEWERKFKQHGDSFDNFLNTNNFNKDVLVFIRNPRKRFTSAFIQDFVKEYLQPSECTLLETFGQIILKDDDLDWWIKNRTVIHRFAGDKDNKLNHSSRLYECLEKLIDSIILGYINGKYEINSLHNGPYLQLLVSILNSNKNTDRVKIYDIDEININDILLQYYDKQLPKVYSSPKEITSITSDLINTNQFLIKKFMTDEITIKEADSYNILKNFNK